MRRVMAANSVKKASKDMEGTFVKSDSNAPYFKTQEL